MPITFFNGSNRTNTTTVNAPSPVDTDYTALYIAIGVIIVMWLYLLQGLITWCNEIIDQRRTAYDTESAAPHHTV